MSICNPCTKVKILPTCLDQIVIGVIEPDTDVFIYLKDHATGRITKFSTNSIDYGGNTIALSSDEDGLLSLFVGDTTFMPSHSYELWITEINTGIDERLTFAVEGIELTCVALRFESVYNYAMELESFASQTLSIL